MMLLSWKCAIALAVIFGLLWIISKALLWDREDEACQPAPVAGIPSPNELELVVVHRWALERATDAPATPAVICCHCGALKAAGTYPPSHGACQPCADKWLEDAHRDTQGIRTPQVQA